MKYMVILKANADSEAGVAPSEEIINGMQKFNEDLANAGVLLAAEGLQASSKGARVKFEADGTKKVTDGPFAETKELVAGFWILQVKSRDEAIEWTKRIPNPGWDEFEVEVRKVFEAEDFGEEFTPEARAAEDKLRERVEAQQQK
ncbi:hypothetical protein CLV47_114105 [Antricoccus suffuscus]|uniref:YCII-related domain-containing protein n=1 Tax=Antricoccus suffuscus TaxID=1629062 RepID=A0A2T0ZX30_9ACTN|nr:YciI family protein [Antricoccus suffuscus]PRZ40807.1 hypothetical protein CLV47_114105 [Antricoccus suffuscus]